MNKHDDFFEFCKRQRFRFNPGINLKPKECFSSELIDLLACKNGQHENSPFMFRRTFAGKFISYKFLDWTNIKRITAEINANPVFKQEISKDLLHFAMTESKENHYEYSGTFAISQNNEIFKCNFSEYDRFAIVRDIGQIKFSRNLDEFLNTQRQLITLDFQQNYK